MNGVTYERLASILRSALEIPDEQRRGFIDEICGRDADLSTAARRMLAFAEADHALLRPGGALAGPLWDALAMDSAEAFDVPADERVGPYRIVRPLGRGGMATVYLAERADGQFEQAVALKILDAAGAAADSAARFQQERQILATLAHPNIARLLDGGTTTSGLPYVVLEYVEGEPIDVYCDRKRLPIGATLELFGRVLDAVHYAHSHLVIHRDLKPTNILVTAAGVPKLLDFGIAKLLDSSAPHAAPGTRSLVHPMTPEYASPEQVRGQPLTTASDVYQLGFLLYRLVTGGPPYAVDRRNCAEMIDAICRRDPERPSQKVPAAGRTTAAPSGSVSPSPDPIGLALATRPRALRRHLRGDLDAIVLKALRKEPRERYASAKAFAEDIDRFLAALPVTARRGTAGYLTRTFIRRHRLGVAASAVIVLLLSALAALHTGRLAAERDRAQLEAAKANEIADFVMSLFEATDPRAGDGEPISAEALLEQGAERAEALGAQPEVQSQMLEIIGRVYRRLGRYDAARAPLERSLSIRSRLFGTESVEAASAMNGLGRVLKDQGDYQAAERLFREAAAVQRRLLGDDHPDLARSLNNQGMALRDMGDYDAAEEAYREALAIRRAAFGAEHADVASTLNNLGLLLMEKGDYDEAEAIHRQTLTLRRKLFGDVHLDITYSLNNLALVLHERGDYDAAEPLYRELLAMDRKLLGEEHPEIALDLNNLAGLLADKGEYEEAEALHRRALAMRRRVLPSGHPDLAQSLHNLGRVLQRRGRPADAEALLREALAIRRAAFGGRHPLVANVLSNLGVLLEEKGEFPEAEDLQRRALSLRRALLGNDHARVADSLHRLATVRGRRGDHRGAESLHREAVAVAAAALGDAHWRTMHYRSALAASLTAQGRFAEAESLLLAADAVLWGGRGDRGLAAAGANEHLVALYDAWGNAEEAERYRRRERR